MVDLGQYESSLKSFETIRIAFIQQSAKATLNFYNAEINSYISLFTSGLKKPDEKLSDKLFEDDLVTAFRKINPNVVQVNVFPKGNDAYVARVYLKSQEEGRKFIVDYGNFRELLVKYYKNKESIRFNINVDDKTMKKIKQYDKRVTQIQTNIKNEADRQKGLNNKHSHPHQIPLHQGGFPMMPPLPHGMMSAPQNKMPMMGGSHPPMPQPGYPMVLNPQMPQMGMPNPMGLGMGMVNPAMGQKNPLIEMRSKIDKMYERKAHFVEECKTDHEHELTVKKQCFEQVKFVIENDLKVPPLQAKLQASNFPLIQIKSSITMTSELLQTS